MEKLNKVENRVAEWSQKFPIDRWWREKHNIPFMSPAHRESSFIDQLFEWYEDKLVNYYSNTEVKPYEPNTGDFLTIKESDTKANIENLKNEFEREFLGG